MLFDEQLLFSDAQAITADAASTKTVETNGDIAKGVPVPIHIQVVEDFNNLTSLTVKVQTSDNSTFTSPVTLQEATLALANLKAGEVFPINYLPTGIKKYIRLYYDIDGTTAPTTGKITAGIVTALDQRAK